jgi:hypothetical protein
LADQDRADPTHARLPFALDMPLGALLMPISAGTDGVQASATPQRKRFFFSSSNWRLRF